MGNLEAQLITHLWHRLLVDVIDYLSWCCRLLINDPLITHRLIYYARKTHFLLYCTIFSFVFFYVSVRRTFLHNLRSFWRNCAFKKGQITFWHVATWSRSQMQIILNPKFNCATTDTRTKFSHLQKMALEALCKESRYLF